jgi:hypothetical protein
MMTASKLPQSRSQTHFHLRVLNNTSEHNSLQAPPHDSSTSIAIKTSLDKTSTEAKLLSQTRSKFKAIVAGMCRTKTSD